MKTYPLASPDVLDARFSSMEMNLCGGSPAIYFNKVSTVRSN